MAKTPELSVSALDALAHMHMAEGALPTQVPDEVLKSLMEAGLARPVETPQGIIFRATPIAAGFTVK